MQKGKTVKRKIKYLVLSIPYYYSLVVEKLLMLKFHVEFIIKHKRFLKKMSTEQVEQLKKFLKEKGELGS